MFKKNILVIISFSVIVLFVVSSQSYAAYFNNYQYIIGERAFGMGGTFTALADDSTALWYNPAGLSRISSKNVNVSANTYGYLHTKTDGYREFQKSDETYEKINVDEEDFSIVANTICFGWQTGKKQAIAFGIFVPIQETTTGTAKSVFDFNDNIHIRFKGEYDLKSKYYVGMLGYGIEPVKKLSLGATVGFGYYKSVSSLERYIYSHITAPSPVAPYEYLLASKVEVETEQYTINSVLGIQYRLTAKNNIALAVHSPAWRLGGQSDISKISANVDTTNYDNDEVSKSIVEDDELYRQVFPCSFSAGYAYTKPGSFSVSAEISPVFETSDRSNNIINGRIGTEIYLYDILVLRAGFFTDYSQKDDIEETTVSDYDPIIEKLDYYGATLSISLASEFGSPKSQERRPKSWTTLGVLARYGTGHVLTARYSRNTSSLLPIYQEPKYIKKSKNILNIGVTIAESVSF